MKMPSKIIDCDAHAFAIGEIVRKEDGWSRENYPWAKRLIGKFPIPAWQRDLCWTEKQNIELIESVFLGIDIGSYMVCSYRPPSGAHNYAPAVDGVLGYLSDILIDGQQRINALVRYSADKFPVFGCRCSELGKGDQRRFMRSNFTRKTVNCFDEDKLKMIYNKLNFAGVPHRKDTILDDVWYNPGLTVIEKFLLIEVVKIHSQGGCYKTNLEIAEAFGLSECVVSAALAVLTRMQLISCHLERVEGGKNIRQMIPSHELLDAQQ